MVMVDRDLSVGDGIFYIFFYFNYPGTAQASQGIPGLPLTSTSMTGTCLWVMV